MDKHRSKSYSNPSSLLNLYRELEQFTLKKNPISKNEIHGNVEKSDSSKVKVGEHHTHVWLSHTSTVVAIDCGPIDGKWFNDIPIVRLSADRPAAQTRAGQHCPRDSIHL